MAISFGSSDDNMASVYEHMILEVFRYHSMDWGRDNHVDDEFNSWARYLLETLRVYVTTPAMAGVSRDLLGDTAIVIGWKFFTHPDADHPDKVHPDSVNIGGARTWYLSPLACSPDMLFELVEATKGDLRLGLSWVLHIMRQRKKRGLDPWMTRAHIHKGVNLYGRPILPR